MDDLLLRGGPLGALLGFTADALMLLPIGYVDGQFRESGRYMGTQAKVWPPATFSAV
jgi:hypothetical protein